MERIEVITTHGGVPLLFVRAGRTWHVGAEPVRWFERVAWWKTAQRLPRDQMTRMDIQVWQVQARIGHNIKSPLVTFELVCGQDRKSWSIRSMESIAA